MMGMSATAAAPGAGCRPTPLSRAQRRRAQRQLASARWQQHMMEGWTVCWNGWTAVFDALIAAENTAVYGPASEEEKKHLSKNPRKAEQTNKQNIDIHPRKVAMNPKSNFTMMKQTFEDRMSEQSDVLDDLELGARGLRMLRREDSLVKPEGEQSDCRKTEINSEPIVNMTKQTPDRLEGMKEKPEGEFAVVLEEKVATENGNLSAGMRVALYGLAARADLNGQLGRVLEWDADAARWNVLMDDGTCKKVKAHNLEPCGADEVDEHPSAGSAASGDSASETNDSEAGSDSSSEPPWVKLERVRALFELCDQDGDGRLNKCELRTFAQRLGFGGPEDAWAKEYCQLCAKNGISAEEGLDFEDYVRLLL